MPTIKNSVEYFREICGIPHPSGHNEKMREYLIAFAKEHRLPYRIDNAGNLLIIREGLKNSPRIIIQAHMDMVPAVQPGIHFNFETDAIPLIEEDGWFKTEGTTLGADDGSGVAIILSLLEEPEEKYKNVTILGLFTVDEEISMVGARVVEPDFLNADALINLDINVDFVLGVGSAGIVSAFFEIPVTSDPANQNLVWYNLTVSGLEGGHSGGDIDKNRANALKLAAEILSQMPDTILSSLKGGVADNVIAPKAQVIFGVPSNIPAIEQTEKFFKTAKETYSDPNLSITIEKTECPKLSYTKELSNAIVSVISKFQQGVLGRDEKGSVWTSANFGGIHEEGKKIKVMMSTRSGNNDKLTESTNTIQELFASYGFTCVSAARSNAWEGMDDSQLAVLANKTYTSLFGTPMIVLKFHAGNECSWFSTINPKLPCIACGPTYFGLHTPNERMSIDALEKEEKFIHALVDKIETDWKK